jgi:plastocyanin
MKTASRILLAAVAACSLPALAQNPGPNKVQYPEKWAEGDLYGIVDRYDIKQYRELWATKGAVAAVKAGKPIPSGTVLTLVQYKAVVDDKGTPVKDDKGRFKKGDLVAYTVMEKRAGWGAEYPDDIRNGEWDYQVFNAEKKVNDKANLKSCFVCHKPHAGQDFVISLARLSGTAPGAKVVAKKGPDIVAISDFLFGPEKLDVKPNTYVTWTNTDDSPHQVTVTSASGLRTAVMLKGQSQTMKFETPGIYDYICGLHPNMKGKIEVTAAK